jgi:hypothetical protein
MTLIEKGLKDTFQTPIQKALKDAFLTLIENFKIPPMEISCSILSIQHQTPSMGNRSANGIYTSVPKNEPIVDKSMLKNVMKTCYENHLARKRHIHIVCKSCRVPCY